VTADSKACIQGVSKARSLDVAVKAAGRIYAARRLDQAMILCALVAALPLGVKMVLTGNGTQFADLPTNGSCPPAMRPHPCGRAYQTGGMDSS
jgi:hypothetical protein